MLSRVRQRCIKVDPSSNLLLDPFELGNQINEDDTRRFQKWSLHGKGTGLEAKLMECFTNPDSTTAEYEDLIERTLFHYKLANQSAMMGPETDTDADKQDGNTMEVDSFDADLACVM